MRIDLLELENFKGFASKQLRLHPEFNLVVGENGSGKTSVLEALSVAAGSWLLGMRGYDTRHIRPEEVRLEQILNGAGSSWERHYPCVVRASGVVQEERLGWERALNGRGGRTTYAGARELKAQASVCAAQVIQGPEVTLPLIGYYGTGRLWNVPPKQARVTEPSALRGVAQRSRLEGYRNSVDPRLSVSDLMTWIAQESWSAFQRRGVESAVFRVAREALIRNVHGATELRFDAAYGEVIVDFEDQRSQPFNNLSDGQRCVLALVGDLARKAATLNPHLGGRALEETPGVVLIDELDLHLHPTWQRRVIEDLRATFPKLQWVCTTHSPFLIQSLRSGEELVMLDGQPFAALEHRSLEEIAHGIQGVADPEISARYAEMRAVAHDYLATLEPARQASGDEREMYKRRLDALLLPYAEDPAFQAILERKRAAALGE